MNYKQIIDTKYILLFISLFVSTLFISNCARLPKPSIKNKTILVVKDELVNTSAYPPQIRLKFNIKSANGLDGNFYVMPSNGNAIISSLEPGKYTVNGYTTHAIGQVTPRKRSTIPLRLKFELKANQITVFNSKVVAKQKPYNTEGGWTFNQQIKNVTSKDKQEVINLLRKDENFSLWRIYEEKKYVQKPKPVPVPKPDRFCTSSYFDAANNENTVKSYKKFLDYCSDKTSYWYLTATRELEELQKQKDPNPDPKVVLPKVITASPP